MQNDRNKKRPTKGTPGGDGLFPAEGAEGQTEGQPHSDAIMTDPGTGTAPEPVMDEAGTAGAEEEDEDEQTRRSQRMEALRKVSERTLWVLGWRHLWFDWMRSYRMNICLGDVVLDKSQRSFTPFLPFLSRWTTIT